MWASSLVRWAPRSALLANVSARRSFLQSMVPHAKQKNTTKATKYSVKPKGKTATLKEKSLEKTITAVKQSAKKPKKSPIAVSTKKKILEVVSSAEIRRAEDAFDSELTEVIQEELAEDIQEDGQKDGQEDEPDEKLEYWSYYADQSTSTTNSPDIERRSVTYSYLASKQADTAPSGGSNKTGTGESKPKPVNPSGTEVSYHVRVNDRRVNLLLPRLDITNAWNIVASPSKPPSYRGPKTDTKLDENSHSTANPLVTDRLKHVEQLGRNFHIIKAAQILFIQKYHLEPPKGSKLQDLEIEFKKELETQNLHDIRLILEKRVKDIEKDTVDITREEFPGGIHAFFTYLGLATMEDSKVIAPRIIYRFLKRCKNPILQQTIWDSNEIEFHEENLRVLREIDESLKEYIQPCKLNNIVFTSSLKPMLLKFNNHILQLPSLPNIKAASEFSYLMDIVFGNHTALSQSPNSSAPPDYLERVKRISQSLDKIGDRIHWVMTQEYFFQRKTSFESLAKSNALFGRFVYLYDFPRANLSEKDHIYKNIGLGGTDNELELLGDLFEKFIAITYMTDSKACVKWLFEIFDTIHEATMISLYQKDVQRFTDSAKIHFRFKPKAPEITYISKEIGESIEKYTTHLLRTKNNELRTIRRFYKRREGDKKVSDGAVLNKTTKEHTREKKVAASGK